MKKSILFLILIVVILLSCKKDNEVVTSIAQPTHDSGHTHTGALELKISNMIDTNMLYLDTVNYVLTNGDKLRVSMYKYYISNIRLIASDSTYFVEQYSYHLINQADESTKTIVIDSVPLGNYIGIQFMIGVDSLHNVSGSQSGDLDPAKGMFWTWNSGYIMAKIEGSSQQSTGIGNGVAFHIGGYKGINSSLKTVSPSFNGVVAQVGQTLVPVVELKCDLGEWFKTPNTVSFSTLNNVTTVNANSKLLSDNYADMFSVTSIHY